MSKKTKKALVVKPQDIYYVKVDQVCTLSEKDSYEMYSSYREEYQTTVSSYIYSTKDEDNYLGRTDSVRCPKDMLKGESAAWLVYVIYSSGDTFGTQVGAYYSIMGIFKLGQLKAAEDFKRHIETIYKLEETTYKTLDGQEIKIYPAWAGYSNSLDSVNIIKVNIDDELADIL